MIDGKLVIAFDTDDTLIIPGFVIGLDRDVPNYETIAIYRWFQAQGFIMVVWSGGGKDYAKMWSDKLGLRPDFIADKSPDVRFGKPDIVFDDSQVNLGAVNVQVKRLNNSISRKDWNQHKEEINGLES